VTVVEVCPTRPDRRHQPNIAISSWTAICIERYDAFVYGTAAALVFPAAFFPSNAPSVGTLPSFATFGVGFSATPLGGLLFGHISHTVPRSTAPVAAPLAMGAATTANGVLPAYNSVGVAAPMTLALPLRSRRRDRATTQRRNHAGHRNVPADRRESTEALRPQDVLAARC
jgi:hypothetical protein